ncbi:hypothetical protein [Janthinobacterium sp. MDB2-8]
MDESGNVVWLGRYKA